MPRERNDIKTLHKSPLIVSLPSQTGSMLPKTPRSLAGPWFCQPRGPLTRGSHQILPGEGPCGLASLFVCSSCPFCPSKGLSPAVAVGPTFRLSRVHLGQPHHTPHGSAWQPPAPCPGTVHPVSWGPRSFRVSPPRGPRPLLSSESSSARPQVLRSGEADLSPCSRSPSRGGGFPPLPSPQHFRAPSWAFSLLQRRFNQVLGSGAPG